MMGKMNLLKGSSSLAFFGFCAEHINGNLLIVLFLGTECLSIVLHAQKQITEWIIVPSQWRESIVGQLLQQSQVPEFGNWESEENVPYTEYFDKARKGKGGVRMNPNDPQDNAPPVRGNPFQQEAEVKGEMGTSDVKSKPKRRTSRKDGELQNYGGVGSGSSKVESEAQKHSDALRPTNECQLSREEGDLSRAADSPLQHETGETPKRVTRKSSGSCIDHSPLHPHYQSRAGGKSSGVSSPSRERKGSSEGSQGLRSRLRSVTRGDDTPDHSPAVPKFGDWDESDPASAEGYSHIFNQVREEKQSGAGKVPVMATDTSYSNGQKQYGKGDSQSCCCFPWGRK